MDVELTPERHDRLTEAGYTLAPTLAPVPVPGRIRVQDSAGQPLDLQLFALPDGAREACIAHLSAWFPVSDPGVEHLVDALDLDDAIGYLTAVAGPCTLETYVTATGRLGAGHTSTVLVTLGRTLARLHAQGLRYGPIRPCDVLVDAGRVVLTVPEPVWTTMPMAPSPQEDAYHLARLADAVIAPAHGPSAPARPEPGLRGLAKLIISAMGDSGSRPGVGTLATLSHDLAPCLPLDPPRDAAHQGNVAEDGAPAGEERGQRAGAHPAAQLRSGLDRPTPRRKAFRGSTPRRSQEHPTDRAAPLRGAGAVRASDPPPLRHPRWVIGVVVAAVLTGLGGGAVVLHRAAGAPADVSAGDEQAGGAVGGGDLAGGELAGGDSVGGELAAGTGAAGGTGTAGLTPGTTVGAQESGEGPDAAAIRLTAARMDRVVALTNAADTEVAAPDLAGPDGGAPVGGTPKGGAPEGGAPGGADAATAQAGGWADVLVPDSPAHVQAAALVASLQETGARISGLTVDIGGAVVLTQAPSSAQVEVTFTVGAYTLESTAGVQTIPASPSRTAVLELVATESGWLVAGVQEVTSER